MMAFPRGIESADVKEVAMAYEDKRTAEEKAAADAKSRKDAEVEERKADAEKLDKMLTGIDAVCAKMDSFEERLGKIEGSKKDSEEEKEKAEEKAEKEKVDAAKNDGEEEDKKPVAVDKAKKDAEEEDEKKARKDSAALATALADIASLKSQMKPLTDADRKAFANTQEKADAAFTAFGDSAPAPMQGETHLDYRLRLIGKLQDHSPVWKGRNVNALTRADASIVDVAEAQVYADATKAALTAVIGELKPGQEREVVRRDDAGRPVKTFIRKDSFVRSFTMQSRRVNRFANPSDRSAR
jgi:hypothetical protein